jgi:hypothetical protein
MSALIGIALSCVQPLDTDTDPSGHTDTDPSGHTDTDPSGHTDTEPAGCGGSWTPIEPAPGGGARHATAWAAERGLMFVWGGSLSGGAVYSPEDDDWDVLPEQIALEEHRHGHSAVWTGEEVVIWGGDTSENWFGTAPSDEGLRYSPAAGSWASLQEEGPPLPRYNHVAVWTGSDVLVWGGYAGGISLADGGKYRPGSSWTPLTDAPHALEHPCGVWTGSELLLWGTAEGKAAGLVFDGNQWSALPLDGDPVARVGHQCAWTGDALFVWGGLRVADGAHLNSGDIYTPAQQSWRSVSTTDAPAPRREHAVVWIPESEKVLVWGGDVSGDAPFDDGGVYDPSTDTWCSTSMQNVPEAREAGFSAVATGDGVVIWGGSNETSALSSGALCRVP